MLRTPDGTGIDLVFLSPYASARMPALLLTSFIWALSFGLLGNCLSGLPASFVALARMAGSFAVFLPFARKAPLSHAVGMMGIGAVQFGGMYLFYIAAFHYLPSHQVALFTATTPIYVVLIDGLMKRIFRRSIWRRLFLQPWEGRESFGKDIPPVTGS